MKYITESLRKVGFLLVFIFLALPGCDDQFSLQEEPHDQLSEGTFWNTKDDAERALRACYRAENYRSWGNNFNRWTIVGIKFECWTDILSNKAVRFNFPTGGIDATFSEMQTMWSSNYVFIARANYFLENIAKINMDQQEKAMMIAEVKFIRAYAYFWLSQMFGDVPLIEKTLSFDEANSISQTSREEVVNFALNDLAEALPDLTLRHTASDKGRAEKGAALALMGRFLMAEQRWSEAAEAYKELIDLNRYVIDPRFKELFEDDGDNSDEIVFARKYIENEMGEPITQQALRPGWYGGYTQMSFYQSFVDKFPMTDGKSIEESTLYDPDNPFENRDPRLYATVLLPDYSVVEGKVYVGHPDSTSQTGPGNTGYSVNKFWDYDYEGDPFNYGGDYPLIRYAEVLLSYLECKLEAGEAITQTLLDQTINKLRAREAVNIALVTETDPNSLRKIIRNERAIELACEGGIRYWDIIRWKIAHEVISQKFYGLKITDDPAGYDGKAIINDEGHIFIQEFKFYDHNYLWPIPQSELDINKNLVQNPGYN